MWNSNYMKIAHCNIFKCYQGILFFPAFLVLFEFTSYIANDMILPGMLTIVADFNVGKEWIPTSMTAYLLGGGTLQWLLGPMADRRGRRVVMLTGVMLFLVFCLAALLAGNIEQFIIMRFLQGIGVCFIGAVGYSTIQDFYDESRCIKIMSLMSNVTLVAPLLGPLLGAMLIHVAPWQSMFLLFSTLATISFFGLLKTMPETAPLKGGELSIASLWQDYYLVLSNYRFITGAFTIGFSGFPLQIWIALAPLILISGEKISTVGYGLLQIPVFSSLIIGNLVVSYLSNKKSAECIVKLGRVPMIVGALIIVVASNFFALPVLFIIAGTSLYAFGLGLANAGLYRLTLFSSDVSKGTVSAALCMISLTTYSIGIEIAKFSYLYYGNVAFGMFVSISCVLCMIMFHFFLKKRL